MTIEEKIKKLEERIALLKKQGNQVYYYLVTFGLTPSGQKAAMVEAQKALSIPDRADVIFWDKTSQKYVYSEGLIQSLREVQFIGGDTYRVAPILKNSGKKFDRNLKVWA